MTKPQRTIQLLDQLKLTDEQFQGIHHFGKKASVAAHRKYCERTAEFRDGGKNHGVLLTLEAIAKQRLMPWEKRNPKSPEEK
jgi:hypothetical protein